MSASKWIPRKLVKSLQAALGVTVAVGLTACPSPTVDPPVGPPVQQPATFALEPYTFVGLQPGVASFRDFTVGVTGTMGATLDWTFSFNDLDIVVTSTSCFVLITCSPIGEASSETAKPERLTVNVTPGSIRVWVANFGPGAESGTLSLSVTGTR